MTGEPRTDPDESDKNDPGTPPPAPPEKMGIAFYAALALIGCLVLMIIFLNYPASQASSGIMMTRTNWTLQSLTDKTGILIPVMSGTDITATFDREGRMAGSAGCNRYTSTYTTHDYGITLSDTATTLMFCAEPGVMDQESAYLEDLSRAALFRVSGSFLKFYDTSGKTVLVFIPA